MFADGTYRLEYAWLGGEQVTPDVVVAIAAGRITAVQADGKANAGAPAEQHGPISQVPGVTIPGFANVHSHAFHRRLRGRSEVGFGSFWTWRGQMYELAATLQPDTMYDCALSAYREMVAAGMTAVGEFHYLHHDVDGKRYNDPNAMTAALVAAASDAGIRIRLLDTCYLSGGLSTTGEPQPLSPVQQRFNDGSFEAWLERVVAADEQYRSDTVAIGAAVHSVRAVDPATIEQIAAAAADHDWPLHAHVSEQPAENQQCLAAYARTPVAIFDDAAALGPRFTAIHATHLTDDDITRLGATRSNVGFCPTTERDLADGIGPAAALVQAGAVLSLGSDSHAVIDHFEEARAVELNERLATGVRGHQRAADLLAAATAHGYQALGWPEGGRIEVGAWADLVTVSLDSIRLADAQPLSMVESLVYAAHPTDIAR